MQRVVDRQLRLRHAGGMVLFCALALLLAGDRVLAVAAEIPRIPAADEAPQRAAARPAIRPEPASREETGLILADRRMIQALQAARERLKQEKFGEGVELLQRLLDAPEDRFFRPEGQEKGVLRSLKSEVFRLLSSMPDEGRNAYELRFGGTAQAKLREATESRNVQALAAVARSYFHTASGAEAAYRLACREFDRGDALAAAVAFERLRTDARRRQQWEPVLTLRAAIAWQQAGFPASARTALEALVERLGPNGRLTLPGGVTLLVKQNDDPRAWLADNFGGEAAEARFGSLDWPMAGGGPTRNGLREQAAAGPLPDWKQPVATVFDPLRMTEDPGPSAIDRTLAGQVESLSATLRQPEARLLFMPQPIVVENHVFVRTLGNLRAIELHSGRIAWEAWRDPVIEACVSPEQAQPPEVRRQPLPAATDSLAQLLARRWFGEALHGDLSSDGEFLFAVEESLVPVAGNPDKPGEPRPRPGGPVPLPLPGPQERALNAAEDRPLQRLRERVQPGVPRKPGPAPPFFSLATPAAPFNTLAAYHLRRPGEIGQRAWTLGGAENDPLGDYPLAGTTFLCAPLPLGGSLYCLAARQDEIRLLALDPRQNGKLIWAQTLGDNPYRFDQFPRNNLQLQRRWCIAYDDGVLVCSSGGGSVVAVELSTRSLLWGYSPSPAAGGQAPGPPNFPGRLPQQPGGWVDEGFLIAGHRLLLPCNTTDRLICLNLLSGEILWQKDRLDGMYIAGAVAGHVVVVGDREVRSWSLESGNSNWQPLKTGKPSGQGVLSGKHLLLPLASGGLATVDIVQGELVSQVKLPGARIPGNLALARGILISQGLRDVVLLPIPVRQP